MSQRLSKYIACCDYFDKSLIVLSVGTGSISIASFATVIGAPVGMMSASFSSITTGFVKTYLKATRNKKKKRNKIAMLARSKLNSIETKISEALINNEFVMKTLWLFLTNKQNIENEKNALEWWIVKEVMLKKLAWLKKAKNQVLMRLLGAMRLLITV